MATRQATSTAAAEAQARPIPWIFLSYLAIGLVALLPRVLNLGTFLTGDEANFWLRRSEIFWRALATGDFAATAISTHPGVTTMWLGGLGLRLQDALLRQRHCHRWLLRDLPGAHAPAHRAGPRRRGAAGLWPAAPAVCGSAGHAGRALLGRRSS